MTIEVSTDSSHDDIFRISCDEMNITYICVKELENGNRYELHFNHMMDLYFLGRYVGLGIGNRITNNLLNQ